MLRNTRTDVFPDPVEFSKSTSSFPSSTPPFPFPTSYSLPPSYKATTKSPPFSTTTLLEDIIESDAFLSSPELEPHVDNALDVPFQTIQAMALEDPADACMGLSLVRELTSTLAPPLLPLARPTDLATLPPFPSDPGSYTTASGSKRKRNTPPPDPPSATTPKAPVLIKPVWGVHTMGPSAMPPSLPTDPLAMQAQAMAPLGVPCQGDGTRFPSRSPFSAFPTAPLPLPPPPPSKSAATHAPSATHKSMMPYIELVFGDLAGQHYAHSLYQFAAGAPALAHVQTHLLHCTCHTLDLIHALIQQQPMAPEPHDPCLQAILDRPIDFAPLLEHAQEIDQYKLPAPAIHIPRHQSIVSYLLESNRTLFKKWIHENDLSAKAALRQSLLALVHRVPEDQVQFNSS